MRCGLLRRLLPVLRVTFVAALERREIVAAPAATAGNKSHAAERLGLSRQGPLNKMARFAIR